MICALCFQQVTLLDLDGEGWCGDPAHKVCADAARAAFAEACDRIAAFHRARNDRLGRRYERLAS